jgi:hypothetical protein
MNQRLGRLIIVSALASLSATQSARAQNAEPVRHPVEITPFASLDSSFSVRTGAAINFAWTPKIKIESEIEIDGSNDAFATSVAALYSMPHTVRVVPYLAAGLGLEQYAFLVTLPLGTGVPVLRLSPTVNLGAGLNVPIGANWSLRSDVRWIGSVGERAPDHVRVFGGITFGAGRR